MLISCSIDDFREQAREVLRFGASSRMWRGRSLIREQSVAACYLKSRSLPPSFQTLGLDRLFVIHAGEKTFHLHRYVKAVAADAILDAGVWELTP